MNLRHIKRRKNLNDKKEEELRRKQVCCNKNITFFHHLLVIYVSHSTARSHSICSFLSHFQFWYWFVEKRSIVKVPQQKALKIVALICFVSRSHKFFLWCWETVEFDTTTMQQIKSMRAALSFIA